MTFLTPGQTAIIDPNGALTQAGREFLRDLADNATQVGDYRQSAQAKLNGGWLVCDGTRVSQTSYPTLYKMIGAQLGAFGGTFPLPRIPFVFASGGTGTAGEVPIMRTWIKAR